MRFIRILIPTVLFSLGLFLPAARAQFHPRQKKPVRRLTVRDSLAALQDIEPPRDVPSRYFFVYAEPLAALDGFNGTSYRLGAEYGWKKWGVYATAGGYFERGYVVRGGFKRTISRKDNLLQSLAFECMHNWHIHTVKDWYAKPDSTSGEGAVIDNSKPSVTYTDEKNITTLSLLYSWEQFWRHGWVFEVYLGAGVKFRDALISIPPALQDQLYYFHHTDYLEPTSDTRGNSVNFDIRIGLKIGHTFWSR